MKIEGRVTGPVAGEIDSSSKVTRVGNTPGQEAGTPESVDVHLSALAQQLREIGGRLTAGDVVDSAKVAEIKLAIAEGRFEIDPEAIADRLLETARELAPEKPSSEP